MGRRTPEQRYKDNVRKQDYKLEEFVMHGIEYANNLICWYRVKKIEMPDEEYRACGYFLNREFKNKPGSLALLYEMSLRCNEELPQVTKENAFDILRFQFKMYAKVLEKGGFS
jgi:hypothetical protein